MMKTESVSICNDFVRVLSDPWDTVWWFGINYYRENGQKWPGGEKPASTGFRNPSLKDAFPILILVCLFFILLKTLFEKYIASPIGTSIGIMQCKSKQHEMTLYPELENVLKTTGYKTPEDDDLLDICNKLGISLRDSQLWVRRRQQMVLSTRHTKFVESFWRFTFYSAMFTYGIYTLWDENYLWDTRYCWYGYPSKIWAIKDKVHWYYMMELGYYLGCLVTHFFDVRRKDSKAMFIHHVVTVLLISISYVCSRTQIGSLVILVHDFSDIPLEACKMAKYAKKMTAANIIFGVFGMSFFVSRIIIFPLKLIYSAVVEAYSVSRLSSSSLIILDSLLCILYVLHLFWFSLIVRLVIRVSRQEELEGDIRSEDEAPSEESDTVNEAKKDI